MKVMVVGSEGYVGRPLCARLQFIGHDILGADCGFYGRFGDIESPDPFVLAQEAIRWGAETVVWLGAIAHDPAGRVPLPTMVRWNSTYPKLCAAKVTPEGIRFVVVSSLAVLSKVGHYSKSKRLLEEMLSHLPEYHHLIRILRFGTIFGGGDPASHRPHLLLNAMARDAVRYGKINIYGEHKQRPVTHIDDAILSLVRAVEIPGPGGSVINAWSTCAQLGHYGDIVAACAKRVFSKPIKMRWFPSGADGRNYGWSESNPGNKIEDEVCDLIRWTKTNIAAVEKVRRAFPANLYKYLKV